VHMLINLKMLSVETILGMGEEEDKGEWWSGWIQVWYTWYILRSFVNAKMPPIQHNNKNK
jgi:hypothetical protein